MTKLAAWWHKLGCGGQFVFVSFALFALMVAYAKIGQALGLVERGNGTYVAPEPRPTYSRRECLSRREADLYERYPNLDRLGETEQNDIARACVAEQRAIEGW